MRRGGLMVSTLAVGLPVISGTAAADHIPQMVVDVPPTISSRPKGQVVTAIYPPADVDDGEQEVMGPEAIVAAVGDDGGFKLGPLDADEDEPGLTDIEPQADAVRWRLVDNGVHGKVLGVFFDASTAEGDAWFSSDDDAAKVSALPADPVDDDDIIAWGFDEVTVSRDGSEGRRF